MPRAASVKLEPGRIVIEEFATPTEVYEKLFRLAQAIHNNEVEFERRVIPALAKNGSIGSRSSTRLKMN